MIAHMEAALMEVRLPKAVRVLVDLFDRICRVNVLFYSYSCSIFSYIYIKRLTKGAINVFNKTIFFVKFKALV